MPLWSNKLVVKATTRSPSWPGECQICDRDGELNGVITFNDGETIHACDPCTARVQQEWVVRPPQ